MAYTNSKEEKLTFIAKFLKALNSKDESLLDECFAQDFKMTIPGTDGKPANDMPLPPGIAGPKVMINALWNGFSDFEWTLQKAIAEDGGDNYLVGRSEWTGVHTGEFMGIPPTGKRVCVRFAAFNKIVDGKIVEAEVFMDVASLLVQLGVLPPPKGF